MTDSTQTAFAHPEARAAQTPWGDTPPDRISLRDHVVKVEIGAFQVERDVTQRLSFNVVVEVAPHDGAATDDVDAILSYDTIAEAIAHELAAERLNLLETLADRIAERILREPQPLRVFLRIEKLDRGPGALGVEIVRCRADGVTADGDDTALHPLVVQLTQGAIATGLATFLDALEGDPRPVILTVGPGAGGCVHAENATAQRRIDLLAIEQNAVAVASLDDRCVVTGTRTELEWAMTQGLICVWAPTKLVLDAVDGPTGTDARSLTGWFAREMLADEVRWSEDAA